jgi:hypothetical protein
MAISMMEKTKIICLMVLVFINLKMDGDTKVNGKMTRLMEKVKDVFFLLLINYL